MRVHWLFGALSLFALGCGTVYQRYTVTPLNPEQTSASAAKSAETTANGGADVGSWFVRQVSNPDESARKEYAYEIVYCATDRGEFFKCRSAVVWSRGAKGGLGLQQPDAPASLVVDEPPRTSRPQSRHDDTPTPSPSARTTEPVTTVTATTPPPSPPPPPSTNVMSVVTDGIDFESLKPDTLGRLRSWSGRPIEITMKSGKSVSGVMRNARAQGVMITRDGKDSIVDWTDVQSVALVNRPE